ncbi:MAG: type II secretion system F family protein [Planctomycetota bacterium]|nr:type II secretion system F family protein [Planctomycetota bacterium]
MIDILTLVAFGAIAFVLFLVGSLFLGRGRNQPDGWQAKPLAFGRLTHLLAAILPIHFENDDSLKRELRRAGYYHRYARDEFIAIRNVLVIGWILLVATALVVSVNPQRDFTIPIVVVGAVITILLFAVPRLILQSQASDRLKQIQHSLPDALDMLNMTMASGMPLQQSLGHVRAEIGKTHPALACELTLVERHMAADSMDSALRRFSDRIDLPDVQSLAALISQTERLGSNVAIALRDYSDSVRRSRLQHAEERGNRNSVAMILPIVFCLAPPIYILLLGPALMELRGFVMRENREDGLLRPDITAIDLLQPSVREPE